VPFRRDAAERSRSRCCAHRSNCCGPFGSWSEPRFDVLARGPRSVAVNLKSEEGREAVPAIVGARRVNRRVPARRSGAVAAWAGDASRATSSLVYGRMTVGARGAARFHGRTRHRLHRSHGALHAIGPNGGGAGSPVESHRRFRRRRVVSRSGVSGGSHARSPGAAKWWTAAMVTAPDRSWPRFTARMQSVFGATSVEQPSRRWCSVLPCLRDRRRRHVAVGAIEPQFYAELLRGLGLDAASSYPHSSTAILGVNVSARFVENLSRQNARRVVRCSPVRDALRRSGPVARRGSQPRARACPTRFR
jgi:alpha-methylacyl-CoA racemase